MDKKLYKIMPITILFLSLLVTILTVSDMGKEYFSKRELVSGIANNSKKVSSGEENYSNSLFGKLKTVENRIDSLIDTINLGYESKLRFRDEIVSVSSIIDTKLFGEKEIYGYTIDNYGMIQSVKNRVDISYCAKSTIQLSQFCNSKGITCFYIMPPCKYIRGVTILNEGIRDYSNENMDAFVEAVSNHMSVIDLREVLFDQLSAPQSCFYKGDHHWRINLAFDAFQTVSKELIQNDDRFKYEQRSKDAGDYNSILYNNVFIGAQSKKIGSLLTGKDDFELIYPNFETSYQIQQKYYNQIIDKREGSFLESLVYNEVFDKLPSDDCYDSYLMYGNTEKIIINNLSNNSLRLLVIGDSFSRPFTCFLADLFHETRTIDTQYNHPNIKDYIENYNPDYVIVMLNSSALGEGYVQTFDFEGIGQP